MENRKKKTENTLENRKRTHTQTNKTHVGCFFTPRRSRKPESIGLTRTTTSNQFLPARWRARWKRPVLWAVDKRTRVLYTWFCELLMSGVFFVNERIYTNVVLACVGVGKFAGGRRRAKAFLWSIFRVGSRRCLFYDMCHHCSGSLIS